MKLNVCVMFLPLICRLRRVDCSLPDSTPATRPLQVETSVNFQSNIVSSLRKNEFGRLPGLCGRLKRRRVTVLCNLEKFCWRGRSQGRGQRLQSGQVCRCPRGFRCSRFFVHSL